MRMDLREINNLCVLLPVVLWLGACGSSGGTTSPPSTPEDVHTVDVDSHSLDTLSSSDVHQTHRTEVAVLESACCLGMSGEWVVWAQDGDIWGLNQNNGQPQALVEHEAEQTDPVIDQNHVVWSDNRNGDFDLYVLDLSTGNVSSLLVADGDQHSPSVSDGQVAYVDQPLPELDTDPIDRRQSDVWLVPLDGSVDAAPLIQDWSEQRYPMIHGTQVVWSDFRNDAEGQYVTGQAVSNNNGDVFGYDLLKQEAVVVTVNPHKQLRPTVHGNTVVWLDWRDAQIGIEPLPKYDNFGLYGREMSSEAEVFLAKGSWKQPELWRRPAFRDGHVAWIIESSVNGEMGSTVQTLSIENGLNDIGSTPMSVVTVSGLVDAIDIASGSVAWIGSGQLGIAALDGIVNLQDKE